MAEQREALSERVLLPLRKDLRLYPAAPSAAGAPRWTLHDPLRQTFFLLGHTEFLILGAWRAGEAIAEALARLRRESAEAIGDADIDALQRFLLENELLDVADPARGPQLAALAERRRSAWMRRALEGYLFFRIPLFRPDRVLDRMLPWARRLASPPALLVWLGGALLGAGMVSRQWDAFLATFPYFFSLEGALLYALVLALVKCAHELGHALVAKHFGLRVPTMGVALLVLWPVLYTDTTEAWKLRSRAARLWVTGAGMATELVLAGIALLAWCFLPDGPARSVAFVVASVTSVLTLAVNLNPFMRFDGYYLLADWLDEPNLQPRSFALARWWLRRVFVGVLEEPPEDLPAPRLRLLVGYALATWAYRAVIMVGIALMLYFLFWKPLGLFLMLVELWVFVFGPVWREWREWWRLAREQRLNPAQRRSLVFAGGLLLLLVLPWQQEITRTALLRPAQYARFYAPEAARIVAVPVRDGQAVAAGSELLRTESPELDYEWRRAIAEVDTLQRQFQRNSAVAGLREFGEVMAGRLAEAQAVARSVAQRRERLRLLAPSAGRVVDLDATLQPGQWIAKGQPLLMLVADERQLVETFVPERELPRVALGARARFHANAGDGAPQPARVVAVDRASTTVLPEPWFADRYDGDVPTRQGARGELQSHEAIYRVLLEPESHADALPRMLPGRVVIEAERRSILGAMAEGVVAVLRREAGI